MLGDGASVGKFAKNMSSYKPLQYNVIIFNNIANNQRDVELLRRTFRARNCRVKLYTNLTLAQFEVAIEKLCYSPFANFEYIAIVVLDNRNEYAHQVTTRDGGTILLNNDLLVHVQQNKSLANRKRLFIVQTNQTLQSDPGPVDTSKNHSVHNDNRLWYGPTVTLYGTGSDTRLKDHWPTANSEPSPFIASFCRNFLTYPDESMRQIYFRMRKDMQNEDFSPEIDECGPIVFGYALSDIEIADHFPDNIRESDADENEN